MYRPSDFKGFDKSTRETLAIVGNGIYKIANVAAYLGQYTSCVGLPLNIIHLAVLLKMERTCINWLTNGIAICDIYETAYIVYGMIYFLLDFYEKW